MNSNDNVNEVKDERCLGRILYDKRKHILFLSLSVITIYTISSITYRRGYKFGSTDGYVRAMDRIIDKIKI